ncbi:MAG: hypothetical protein DWQ05_09705 [Calditrichaeota bacterium]|nr:MAG: hypothetical protein DWQ05_09705 [Calditrichota bacterium]
MTGSFFKIFTAFKFSSQQPVENGIALISRSAIIIYLSKNNNDFQIKRYQVNRVGNFAKY